MNKLRELRESRGLPQKELAALLGKTVQAYSLYELDKRNIDNEALKILSQFYNVTTDFLLGNEAARDINSPGTLQPTKQELEHIKKYRQLDADDKNKTDGFMMALLMDDKYKKTEKAC